MMLALYYYSFGIDMWCASSENQSNGFPALYAALSSGTYEKWGVGEDEAVGLAPELVYKRNCSIIAVHR